MTRLTVSILRHLILLFALVLLVGMPALAPAAEEAENHERLIHLPGIAGSRLLDRYFVKGLSEGGYAGEVEIYDWTAGDPGLGALLARRRNDEQAERLAERLKGLLTDDPDLKIRLVGHSGGAGIAAWALERLPEGMQIETLVFVAPALSQRYDLSGALAHVRDKAYAFTSENDVIVLGAGTRMLGTIDGVKEEASGLRGFIQPKDADDKQYDKLVQLPYTAAWMKFDNIGDHIGPMGRRFAAKVISPIVQGKAPPATQPAERSEGRSDEASDDSVEQTERSDRDAKTSKPAPR